MSISKKKLAERFGINLPDWHPDNRLYVLVFTNVNGEIREVSGMMPKYFNILLSEYLNIMGIYNIPDYCTSMLIKAPGYIINYDNYGVYTRIIYDNREFA